MSEPARCCPGCGSARIASRRQLFRALVTGRPLAGGFGWYSEGTPGAFPPRSLALMQALPMGALGLIAAALWTRGVEQALLWLPVPLLALLCCIAYDLLGTLRRYRAWGCQWLCGECRAVFQQVSAAREGFPT